VVFEAVLHAVTAVLLAVIHPMGALPLHSWGVLLLFPSVAVFLREGVVVLSLMGVLVLLLVVDVLVADVQEVQGALPEALYRGLEVLDVVVQTDSEGMHALRVGVLHHSWDHEEKEGPHALLVGVLLTLGDEVLEWEGRDRQGYQVNPSVLLSYLLLQGLSWEHSDR